jgi:hypothetical protein
MLSIIITSISIWLNPLFMKERRDGGGVAIPSKRHLSNGTANLWMPVSVSLKGLRLLIY